MRFAITGQQKSYYNLHRFIEFEDLISEDMAKEVARAIRSSKISRDLWRESPVIERLSLSKKIAEIAAQLNNKKKLRIAYDQTVQPGMALESGLVLKQMSCFQKIIGGALIFIDVATPSEEIPEELSFIPRKTGNAIFFVPDVPLDFTPLIASKDALCLLIVYCNDNAIYVRETRDNFTHECKKLGYGFGDKLSNRTHPIVFS